MADYLAICHIRGEQVIKRISLNQNVQNQIDNLFNAQEQSFRENVDEEIAFNGDWKPDENQILVCDITDNAQAILHAISENALALPELDADNFINEGIKAIVTGRGMAGFERVLIQTFTPQQILSKKFSLLLDNNMFNKLDKPSFSLGTSISAIIENGQIKFKSYHKVRTIFELTNYYQEATDEDIDQFSQHNVMQINDLQAFKELADQTIRKLVHAIEKNEVLNNHTATEIKTRAELIDLEINVANGKVQMPTDKSAIKQLLQFLHDDIFEAPLSGNKYLSNSKKLV